MVAQRADTVPLFIAIGLGDPWVFMDALDLHGHIKGDFTLIRKSGDGRGATRRRSGGEGNVSFASE